MKPHSQRGVALVITLVMLSVVTLMAITFLAVSRRQRASVALTDEQTASRLMADTAVARAKAEVITRVLTTGSLLADDLMVSTNFINPNGFDPTLSLAVPNLININYDYLKTGGKLTALDHRLRNIANLQIDPRPPVYISLLPGANLDFRFFLDLNRNQQFETNGWQPVLGNNGLPLSPTTNQWQVGDPEWIGALAYPDAPHSATNRFIGRYAYLILPVGKSLDLNYIHNNARLGRSDTEMLSIGYYRNQGVGSWELNLAAFLHDLNTNLCFQYDYQGLKPLIQPNTDTNSFGAALRFLRCRYDSDYRTLAPADRWFVNTNGLSVASALTRDNLDTYAIAPPATNYRAPTNDYDIVNRPWAGSDTPNTYFELNDLFNTNKVPPGWKTALTNLATLSRTVPTQGRSTYDRYTFYRLLGQMGMDSTPALQNKINLNYDNLFPYQATNLVPWAPTRFFPAVANGLIQSTRVTNIVFYPKGLVFTNYYIGEHLVRGGLSVSNIRIYPFNEYSSSLHRLLQVAVNLYDATTNRAATPYPYLPTVFRPTFAGAGNNIYISGYQEVTDAAFLLQSIKAHLYDLNNADDRKRLTNDPLAVVYGVPFLIGAKKGFPNFNEFALQNVAQMTRKAELRKTSREARPSQTNLVYQLTISNQFGLEAWNSHTRTFDRRLRLQAEGDFFVMVSNTPPLGAGSILRFSSNHYETNIILSQWPGRQFRVPIHRGVTVATNDVYSPAPPQLKPGSANIAFVRNLGFYVPYVTLHFTNRCYYALVDTNANRIVDFVCLGGMATDLDLTRELAGHAQIVTVAGQVKEPAELWGTNWVNVQNQIEISLGNIPVSSQQWRSFSATSAEGRDKEKSIDRLRLFCGLTPLFYWSPAERTGLLAELRNKTSIQAGFSPTRKVYQDLSWQANDPLVHYTVGDLVDPYNRPDDPARTNAVRFVAPQTVLTNSNLGLLNQRYQPWGGNPNQSVDPVARDFRFKDPLITRSDDWEFPTNKFPNIGWIGRVHRGTPWQTLYLKADIAPTTNWSKWSGNFGTHPTNDWNFVELFTTAINDNAARGLLSVNQTNLAAWSAVLNGVSILLPTDGRGGVTNAWIGPSPPPPKATNLVPDIVTGLNRVRQWETNLVSGGRGLPLFQRMGRVLATPELTFGSSTATNRDGSWARWLAYTPRDEVLEGIPQQILSLLKEDEPRFAVYAFGQALREAPNSVYLGSGSFYKLCTNYQVTAEFVSKSIIRLDGPPTNPKAVVESYNEITTE